MYGPSWNQALRRWIQTLPRTPRFRRKPRLGTDWFLEERVTPSGGITGPAFDQAGRAVPGSRSMIDDQLLWLFNAYQDRGANWADPGPGDSHGPLTSSPQDLQVDAGGRVFARVMANDVGTLRPKLTAIGFEE